MKRILVCISFFIFIIGNLYAQSDMKGILKELDQVVRDKSKYQAKKNAEINVLKGQLLQSNKNRSFQALGKIYEAYKQYNIDSARYYVGRQIEVAVKSNNPDYIIEAKLNLVEWNKNVGMFGQAESLLMSLTNKVRKNRQLLVKYYNIYSSFYDLLSKYSSTKQLQRYFADLCDHYNDSTLTILPRGTVTYRRTLADRERYHYHFTYALNVELPDMKRIDPNDQDVRYIACNIARSYQALGQLEEAKYYYAVSAISDIKHCVKEHISLRSLSMILFQEGDIDRANKYITSCLEDANYCRARSREIEIANDLPTIVQSYQAKMENENLRLSIILVALVFIAGCMIVMIVYSRRQNRKLSFARKEVLKANASLQDSVRQLRESNNIKEEYITQYLNLCSTYLQNIDEYRHSLIQIAQGGKVDKLFTALRSSQFIEEQLHLFYSNFDESFLHLFPTFVDEFNKLFSDENFIPKASGQLTTELRIFALIRLGITDSNYIAKFLRCSIQTVYNYRSKIRGKSRYGENDFEKKVKAIGSTHD